MATDYRSSMLRPLVPSPGGFKTFQLVRPLMLMYEVIWAILPSMMKSVHWWLAQLTNLHVCIRSFTPLSITDLTAGRLTVQWPLRKISKAGEKFPAILSWSPAYRTASVTLLSDIILNSLALLRTSKKII